MKVLVTGSSGQLARSLVERASSWSNLEVIAVGRPELDFEIRGSADRVIAAVAPDVVINAAAYTGVDQAEDEPELARRINADAAGEAAEAAAALGIPIIQLSTDYVFDGSCDRSYTEGSAVGPINTYGRTKLEGEELVRRASSNHMIVRTSWVYSPFGRNFVNTMLRLARERDEVTVVDDQYGSPTSANELADPLLHVIDLWRGGSTTGQGGTYHIAGKGQCSWAEFADEIFRQSKARGGPTAAVRRISSSEYATRARRPRNSTLDSARFERDFNIALPRWRSALGETVDRLVKLQ